MKTFIASGGSRNRKRILDAINVSMNENFNIKIYERLSLKLIKKNYFFARTTNKLCLNLL